MRRRRRRLVEQMQRTYTTSVKSVRCTCKKLLTALGGHIFRQLGSQVGEWQALQPDPPRAGQRGEEQPLTAEQHVGETLDRRDVIVNSRLKTGDVTGVHFHRFAGL